MVNGSRLAWKATKSFSRGMANSNVITHSGRSAWNNPGSGDAAMGVGIVLIAVAGAIYVAFWAIVGAFWLTYHILRGIFLFIRFIVRKIRDRETRPTRSVKVRAAKVIKPGKAKWVGTYTEGPYAGLALWRYRDGSTELRHVPNPELVPVRRAV